MSDKNTNMSKVIRLGRQAPGEMTVATFAEYMADITRKEWRTPEEIDRQPPAVRISGLESLKTKAKLVVNKDAEKVTSFPKPNT